MTVKDQIWRSSDGALLQDQASYQRALARGAMPEMRGLWLEALSLIDEEIETRARVTRHTRVWNLAPVLEEAPF